jgi:hypothetical protein
MGLLDGISSATLRGLGIEALRAWRHRPPPPFSCPNDRFEGPSAAIFVLHADFGVQLINVLARYKELPAQNINSMKEAFVDDGVMQTEWMGSVLEFLWWLERAGFAVPLAFGKKADPSYPNDSDQRWYPTSMRLTARGVRLLDGSDDNPMLPGFLDRIKDRCHGLPGGAIALLVDARACLDHPLMRPAIVLMGVAYELVIEHVVDVLVDEKSFLPSISRETAKDRIKRIRGLLANDGTAKALLPDSDARTAAAAAYDFAETLRQRRNDAAHTKPAFDFEHAEEAEEFLISAGRHLPALWSLAV